MSRSKISFFSEDTDFTLKQKTNIRTWINTVITTEGKNSGYLNLIFCSDNYLLNINQQYLNHDTYTDIITFDSSEEEDRIEGDVFISIDRVRENASNFGILEKDEIHRVIVHGILHLLGYKDKSKNDKDLMTSKEDYYLSHRQF
ncbi:rRNA maturation RNase YbeY [Pararcticibacter amylolyticus]|uniref:Endoribonuclease YbeY n=1 Tax=Pararcticibacter amylolyticus TaxID=2173175 RepID=A0A2U2PMK9_9SPHI|nr:rRNA maturation RNase YbeY [Pararcticibacter amylolyticus]PWG82631.1 rRNA maturation RNase YbeY [Pararcticibacter amylolyticus]